MNLPNTVKNSALWFTSIAVTALFYIFAEGWVILAAKLYGALWATVIVSAVTTPVVWLVIYMATRSNANRFLRDWLAKKEAELSKRAKVAVKGGKIFAVLNATIFLGPILASLLMLILGIAVRRVYVYAVLSAILCAGVWCSLYAGVFWGISKIFS
ncbi:MAG: hypothetical protein ISS92_02835 [Candidatus Omnitrophica bacterium]|nr:hypothetical protein [Candidatus Omnitrophota bacterium]